MHRKYAIFCNFFFDKGENAIQAAESVNNVYVHDPEPANPEQFRFIDSAPVILLSKLHHALEDHLSKISIKRLLLVLKNGSLTKNSNENCSDEIAMSQRKCWSSQN